MPRARAARAIGRLRAASRAHDASLAAVAVRAARLSRGGWRLADATLLGLLDPKEGPAREAWAVRRRDMDAAQDALNDPAAVARIQDKRWFARTAAERGIPTPPAVATLERRDGTDATVAAWADQLRATTPEWLVIKPADGMGAAGVHVVRRDGDGAGVTDHTGAAMSWADLARRLAAHPAAAFIAQERLAPHPALRELTGQDALQTVRVITVRPPGGGPPEALYSALRIATGGAAVDNFRAANGRTTGNLIARVTGQGTLALPYGVHPSGCGLVRVPTHPDSGRTLEGAALPLWDQVRELALRAAEAFPEVTVVGWDIAPTAQGAVVVEGNGGWAASGDPDGALVDVLHRLREVATIRDEA